jgi:hypothetical protein
MRAVWSYWSVPYRARRGFSWTAERTHALSWVLSVELARPYFDSIALHTDDEGARFLVDRLGLCFDSVCLSLNQLRHEDPDWWMMGKLQTYAEQTEPFVHIDSDVYLFKPLPRRLTSAPVLAQNPEQVGPGCFWYGVESCEIALRTRGDGFIPPEWTWYRTFVPHQRAACCGILGGNNVAFLRDYAQSVLRILKSPGNRHAFDHDPLKRDYNPFFEQYLLAAFAAHRGIPVAYLFESFDDGIRSAAAQGFTHLMAEAKRDARTAARIEQRVARDYPEAFRRCLRMLPPARVCA